MFRSASGVISLMLTKLLRHQLTFGQDQSIEFHLCSEMHLTLTPPPLPPKKTNHVYIVPLEGIGCLYSEALLGEGGGVLNNP